MKTQLLRYGMSPNRLWFDLLPLWPLWSQLSIHYKKWLKALKPEGTTFDSKWNWFRRAYRILAHWWLFLLPCQWHFWLDSLFYWIIKLQFFFCSFIFYCYFIFDWVWFVFACVCVCVLLLLLLLLLWGNCNSWERVTWIFMSAAPTNRVRVVIEPSNGGSSFLAFESKDRNRHLWKTCPCFVAFYFFFCFLFLFFFFFFFFFFFVFVFTFPFSSFAFFDSVSLRRVDMRCTYVASTEMNLRRLLWGAVVCDVGLLSCYFRSCFKSDCFSFKMRLFSRTQGHFINWMALNMMSPM